MFILGVLLTLVALVFVPEKQLTTWHRKAREQLKKLTG